MTTEEIEVFTNVFDIFREKYHNRDLELITEDSSHTVVYMNNNPAFCISGYNLLYCLNRLTNLLEDELR